MMQTPGIASSAGRHCKRHHHRRQCLAQDGLRRNIAVSDRGQGNDCPVDAARNAGEAIGSALDDIHQGAEDDHQGHYRVDKDGNLVAARPQRLHEEPRLPEVGNQLQDTEDAQDAQNTDDQQVLASRQQQADVGRDDRQQIDHPVKTDGVFERPVDTKEPQKVFDSEHDRKEPLDPVEQEAVM